MFKTKSLMLISCAALLALSCDQNNKQEKVDPQAPEIESVTLRGENGATEVSANATVKFTANVSVNGSELESYNIEIKDKGGNSLASDNGALDGTSAVVEKTFELPLNSSSIEADFYPEVIFKVTNIDGMLTEKKLSDEENVKILAPKVYDKLYIVDNNNAVFEMTKTSIKGKYRTTGDISNIGRSFTVASRLTGGNAIDPSGEKWEGLTTPSGGEYGLLWIGFDTFTQKVTKMIDHTEVFDYNAMGEDAASDASGKKYKVFWARTLITDCKVEFINYPADVKIQGDRFEDIEGNTARYTGQDCSNFEVYYVQDASWLIVKYQWNVPDVIWATGENASVPMSPYCEKYPLNWFDNSPNGKCSISTVSFVKEGSDNWRALLYFKGNFGVKLYTGYGWAFEVSPWTSETPDTLVISPIEEIDGKLDGNYGNAGPSFTEGLYMLYFNSTTYKASLVKYNGEVPVVRQN